MAWQQLLISQLYATSSMSCITNGNHENSTTFRSCSVLNLNAPPLVWRCAGLSCSKWWIFLWVNMSENVLQILIPHFMKSWKNMTTSSLRRSHSRLVKESLFRLFLQIYINHISVWSLLRTILTFYFYFNSPSDIELFLSLFEGILSTVWGRS